MNNDVVTNTFKTLNEQGSFTTPFKLKRGSMSVERFLFPMCLMTAVLVSRVAFMAPKQEVKPQTSYEYSVEGQLSAFFPTSNRFRSVYANCLTMYGIQVNKKLDSRWELWSGLDFYSKSSKVKGDCCRSRIFFPNFNLGINYVGVSLPHIDVSLGLGGMSGMVFLENRSCCGREKESVYAAGGMIRCSTRWYFVPKLFADFFGAYSYQVAFFRHHVDMSGFRLGCGLGIRF